MRRLPQPLDADDRLDAAIDRLWSRHRPLFGDPAGAAGLTDDRLVGRERSAAFLAFAAILNAHATKARLRSGRRVHPTSGVGTAI